MNTTTQTTTSGRTPSVGEKAPDFTLNTTEGTPWSLQQATRNGPVVLLFMPGAFTTPCTKEVCAISANLPDYTKLGAQVVGVTVDSKHAQKTWISKEGIKFPLVSDFEKRVLQEWGLAWNSSWGNTFKRSTFVVDRDGTVQYANVQANASDEPAYAEIQSALAGLK